MRGSGRGLLAVVAVALLSFAVASSCGNSKPVGVTDAGGVTTLAACLDRPDELPRPPTAGLPCELIPPGLALK